MIYNIVMFSDWVNEQLKNRGWSQAELARRTGLTRGGISLIVQGKTSPNPETIEKIAAAFNVTTDSVFRLVVGITDAPRDPWVEETSYKISRIKSPDLRELITDIITTIAERESKEHRK